jgi:hypothetical protein
MTLEERIANLEAELDALRVEASRVFGPFREIFTAKDDGAGWQETYLASGTPAAMTAGRSDTTAPVELPEGEYVLLEVPDGGAAMAYVKLTGDSGIKDMRWNNTTKKIEVTYDNTTWVEKITFGPCPTP